ncbi:hybrid sensor histidine kinase/response regulator [Microcoleus sp. FACHB-1515]|uniref:hybrid sensor histidine kinase/response regulator n=1 Tax=Cyanophyceae TaxID=3028117 RepID=UPI001683DFC9|nr:hybrid sensor histidine kinase/response regulator [Microcoleus sp. FACHB-1515]MBD2091180.1 hybrid sensor histidine kinase/response regulator [Microcoleus sp. FACHB-1515]
MNSIPALTKGNILIVDDTPNNLRLLSSMLTQQGYEVRSAISGAVALMAVRTVHPDLILLDISMPKMGGYEVCEQLKADPQTQDIPVIFLSALSEAIDKVRAFQVGGVDYITKPFQVEEVLARVENQLTLRRMQMDLQQAKAEALKALEQEKELNRLKTEFVSMISHDFRSPLTSIRGFSELLRQTLPSGKPALSPDVQARYFEKIDGAIDHMLNLLDEVLLIGSLESGKARYEPIAMDLFSFCQELVEVLQVSSDRHQLRLVCSGVSNVGEIDPTLLRQILTNLISNAMKYSPNGGTIQFTLDCQDGWATFQIQDQGIGIPAANQPHLFETFYRCNNVGSIKGTGLGLAVVKRCVETHHGSISIASTEGVGTTVTVTLPLRAIEPLASA